MAAQEEIVLQKTSLPHIFLCDVDDSGYMKEIMLVKQFKDGSIYYIEVGTLHAIDKGRIKKIVSSQHAQHYPGWELLSQAKLSNGMNALDFFHSNNVRVKRTKNARIANEQTSLESVAAYGTDRMVGEEFTDPSTAQVDSGKGRRR